MVDVVGFYAGDLATLPWTATRSRGQIFFVNGKNPLPTRQSTDPAPTMAIFGGTTEIQEEIIARSLGL